MLRVRISCVLRGAVTLACSITTTRVSALIHSHHQRIRYRQA